MTQRTAMLGLGRHRRLAVGVAWLGTAALVIGGSTSAIAAPSPTPVVPSEAAAGPVDVPPALGGTQAPVVPGEYLVTLKTGTGVQAGGMLRTASTADQVKAAAARGRKVGAEVTDEFSAALPGYAATLSTTELAAVRADPAVASVQPNRTYRIAATQKNPTWGLDRIDQRSLPLNKSYYATASGKGVTAYVIDTGIATGHPDFGSVATGPDIIADGRGSEDCNGHGTHVAGTIGGGRYGVAKNVKLVAVRVFNCTGEGTSAGLLSGIDYVLSQPADGPRVANLSLGGDGIDAAVDAGITKMIRAGIVVVLAAGNGDAQGNGQSACSISPAHVRAAITVGATTSADNRTTFSNYGSCVDLYAPGSNITSDYIADSQGNWRIARMSGTSMAAPHVTGTVAMYLERHRTATPAQVQAALLKAATPNKVKRVSSQWPRLLLMGLQKAPVPASVNGGNKLRYNQSLVRTAKLCSANGAYCLSHSSTGKLLLRKVTGTKKNVWSSGGGATWTRMTSTGALSSYDSYGRRVWTSNKTGGRATLYVISTGYLKIVRDSDGKTLWTSRG